MMPINLTESEHLREKVFHAICPYTRANSQSTYTNAKARIGQSGELTRGTITKSFMPILIVDFALFRVSEYLVSFGDVAKLRANQDDSFIVASNANDRQDLVLYPQHLGCDQGGV